MSVRGEVLSGDLNPPTNDSVIVLRGVPPPQSEEELTDGCDDGPGEEEGGADVPQAGLVEGAS